MCTKFLLEGLKGRDHLEGLGIDERIILLLLFIYCNWVCTRWQWMDLREISLGV
jgi:hypothetical protein